jgi:hypothetical protein
VEELFGLITKKIYDSNVIVSSSNSGNNSNNSNNSKKDKKDKHNSKNDIARLTFSEINGSRDNIGSLDTFASSKNNKHGKHGCIIL